MNLYTQKLTREEVVAVLKTHTFLDPLWDASFKILIADEQHPERLVHFLNSLLRLAGDDRISTATLQGTEQEVLFGWEKKVRFDIHCRNQNNEPIIVELQRNGHVGYKDRMLFYSAVAIRKEVTPQSTSYNLPRIYVLALLNFQLEAVQQDYHHTIMLYDLEHREVFYNKLTFVYIELPRFTKGSKELVSEEERWLYALRTMGEAKTRPQELSGPIFESLFESAKISTFDDVNLNMVAETMIDQADRNDEIAWGVKKGLEQGLEQGIEQGKELDKIETTQGMLAKGYDWTTITDITHLDQPAYEALRTKHNR